MSTFDLGALSADLRDRQRAEKECCEYYRELHIHPPLSAVLDDGHLDPPQRKATDQGN